MTNPDASSGYFSRMYAQRFASAAFLLLLGAFLGGCATTSRYTGMLGDDLYDLGARSFENEDWDEAIEAFERLLFAEPTYARLVEARMYLARAYYNNGDFITAVSEFTRIVERHPGHELAPEASLGICMSYAELSPHVQRDQSYTVQAWNACRNTMTDFQGRPAATQAREIRDRMESKLAEKIYIGGEFYFRRKIYHSGIIYFNDLLAQYPTNQWAAWALLRLYESYTALEWDTEAEEAKARLLRDFPDSDAAREIGTGGHAAPSQGGGSPEGGPASDGVR